jgi:hypothetical protein
MQPALLQLYVLDSTTFSVQYHGETTERRMPASLHKTFNAHLYYNIRTLHAAAS